MEQSDEPNPFLIEALQHAKKGEYKEALDILDTLTDLDQGDDMIWVTRGKVLANLGRYMESYRAFSTALKVNPENKSARNSIDIIKQRISEEIPLPGPVAPPPDQGTPVFEPVITSSEAPPVSGPVYKSNVLLFIWPLFALILSFGGLFGVALMLLLSAILIAADASHINAGRNKNPTNGSTVTWSPWEWGILMVMFLIIFYPLYMIRRRAIFEHNLNPQFYQAREGLSNAAALVILLIILIIAFVLFFGVPILTYRTIIY